MTVAPVCLIHSPSVSNVTCQRRVQAATHISPALIVRSYWWMCWPQLTPGPMLFLTLKVRSPRFDCFRTGRRTFSDPPAPPPSRHDHSGVVRPLSYSRPHQAGTTTPMAASRASRGSASSKPSIIGVLAERHARHLAERAQTLQDARKPMHTDPSTIWVICYQKTTQEPCSGRASASECPALPLASPPAHFCRQPPRVGVRRPIAGLAQAGIFAFIADTGGHLVTVTTPAGHPSIQPS